MADGGAQGHAGKWPRRLVPEEMHYIVHKVAEATVRDGAVVLSCVDQDGRQYGPGPYHQSVFKEHRRPIREYLDAWGIGRVEDVGYVVAYYSGGFVNGIVVRLLKGEEDVEALVARVIETRAHLAKSDGEIGVIVSRWRRKPPAPPSSLSPPADERPPGDDGLPPINWVTGEEAGALIITDAPGPGGAKKPARKPPKASPTGDEDDHTGE